METFTTLSKKKSITEKDIYFAVTDLIEIVVRANDNVEKEIAQNGDSQELNSKFSKRAFNLMQVLKHEFSLMKKMAANFEEKSADMIEQDAVTFESLVLYVLTHMASVKDTIDLVDLLKRILIGPILSKVDERSTYLRRFITTSISIKKIQS